MNAPLPNSIAALAPELTDWRRDLHQHPELGYQETRTAAAVAEKLRAFGCDLVETGIGGTGVVAVVHGAGGPASSPEEAILIRADMDALPIAETTGAPYASENEGVMHACGHDGHTTMLLGAAKHVAATRTFKGTVYFCFQPAEEGGAGAKAMIDDGLFQRFDAGRVFGMHNWPGLPVGQFAVKPGPIMAAADEFRITLTGRGGHAAMPNLARDPLVAGAYLVTQLQTLVSRTVDPLEPAVVSVTTFHAGSAFNIIADRCELGGTVRSFSEETHALIYAGIERLMTQTAAAYEMEARIEQAPNGYPPTVNDPAAAALCRETLEALAGPGGTHTEFPSTMGGEDFAFMARERPGCFVFCGNGDSASLHHPKYDFNDEALPHGVAFWASLVEKALPKS